MSRRRDAGVTSLRPCASLTWSLPLPVKLERAKYCRGGESSSSLSSVRMSAGDCFLKAAAGTDSTKKHSKLSLSAWNLCRREKSGKTLTNGVSYAAHKDFLFDVSFS